MDLIDLEEETIDAEILDSMAVSQDLPGHVVACVEVAPTNKD